MSECVVRMEMPKGCYSCPFKEATPEWWCCELHDSYTPIRGQLPMNRTSWCPIICQLPEGHGDLIDRDVLLQTFQNADYETYNDYCEAFDTTEAAETIVPAEAERSET